MTFIWKNGRFHTDEHLISVCDRALRGDGVFTTMLCVDGMPIHLNLHIERISNNAKILGLPLLKDNKWEGELKNAVKALIEKNNATKGQYCLTITITRGIAERGLATPLQTEPTIFIRLAPAPEHMPPLHAIIAQSVRRNEGSPLSQIKTLNYGDHILARQEAENAGAHEAILLNNAGHVTCFTVGNLFIANNGQLSTPPLSDGVMDGIIRRLWIERGSITERSLTVTDLETADGIFMTNSLRGIIAIGRLGDKTFGNADTPFDADIHLG